MTFAEGLADGIWVEAGVEAWPWVVAESRLWTGTEVGAGVEEEEVGAAVEGGVTEKTAT